MNKLGSYSLRDGRAPNPGSLAVLVNPSDPPKKKGTKMAKHKKKQSAKARAASMKNLQKARAALGQGRKANSPAKKRKKNQQEASESQKKTATKRKTVEAKSVSVSRGEKGHLKVSYRKRNPDTSDVLGRNFSFQAVMESFGPVLMAVGGWAFSGVIQAILGSENRVKLAQSLVAQGGNPKDGLSRSKALISGLSYLAVWLLTEKVDALEKYKKPARIGAGIRLAFDVADMLLPRATDPNAGMWGPGFRSLLGLPDGTDFSFGEAPTAPVKPGLSQTPSTEGFQYFQPIQTRGFQWFQPVTVQGWPGQRLERANAPFPPQALLAPPIQVPQARLRGNSGVIPTENSEYSGFTL